MGKSVVEVERKKRLNGHKKQKTSVNVFVKFFPPPMKVLDLGVRNGYEVKLMNKRGYDVIGTDIDNEWIEYAHNVKKRNVIYDDIMNTKLTKNSFDAIFGRHVLEHVEPTEKFLEICHGLLKPRGKIFFIFPLEPRERKHKKHPVRYPKIDDFREIIRDVKFETLYIGYSKHLGVFPFSHRMGEALYIAEKI